MGVADQGGSEGGVGAADQDDGEGEDGESEGSVRVPEKDGSGLACGAKDRRSAKRNPHLWQNWPEVATPHLGQVSAGPAAAPGRPA